jgi:hypothetical protein
MAGTMPTIFGSWRRVRRERPRRGIEGIAKAPPKAGLVWSTRQQWRGYTGSGVSSTIW